MVIVLDDLGFAQLGCYGSDIETPNLDRVAARGIRFTNFHTTAICSPTRACLLTGRNHHRVGMGMLPDLPLPFPGYTGRFPDGAGTLAEILRRHGWATRAIGKWHLVPRDQRATGPFDMWPTRVGFERYYGFLNGETNQWTPSLIRDQHHVEPPRTPEEGYHLDADLADEAIAQLRELRVNQPSRPFLLWYATAAPHAPHQVPAEWIERYRGRFDEGWDVWRERVLARQIELGVVPPDTVLSPRPSWVPAWDELPADQRRLYARMMEVFAAFVTHCDHHIGRVLDHLDDSGELDDTLVVVVSDNGCSAEGGPHGSWNQHRHYISDEPDDLEAELAHIDDLGGHRSSGHYPWGWALAGNTPFRRWKRYTYEGGVRDPLIISWPNGIPSAGVPGTEHPGGRDPGADVAQPTQQAQQSQPTQQAQQAQPSQQAQQAQPTQQAQRTEQLRHQFCHAVDVMPTVLDLVGIEPPAELGGTPQLSLDGTSLRPVLDDPGGPEVRTVQYFECWGSRAIYRDGWKAVTDHVNQLTAAERDAVEGSHDFATDRWALYDTRNDPTESHDLAGEHPELLAELVATWHAEAERNGVMPLDDGGPARYLHLHLPWTEPRRRWVLGPGDRVHESHGPGLGGGFVLRARFEPALVVGPPAPGSPGPDGPTRSRPGQVLCEQGDWITGWAWFLVDGEMRWVMAVDGHEDRLHAPLPERVDELVVEARPVDGRLDLVARADGTAIGSSRTTRAVPLAWAPDGAFLTVARSRPFPVCDDYTPPAPGPASLVELVIETGTPRPRSSPDPASPDPADREPASRVVLDRDTFDQAMRHQ